MSSKIEIGTVSVEWLGHASVKIRNRDGSLIYIDPWSEVVNEEQKEKADIIVLTHDHFDHFDKDLIESLQKENTIIVGDEKLEEKLPDHMNFKGIKDNKSAEALETTVKGFPAYNIDKYRAPDEPYHPKGLCTAAIIRLNDLNFYYASDTDIIPEMDRLEKEKIDVAFLPIGGKYTMDQEEAITALNKIEPEKVIPIHYGHLDDTTAKTEKFRKDVTEKTTAEPHILENN